MIEKKELDKKTHYTVLFSYYQSLLTEKQKDFFISYYDEDYSLSEIAVANSISKNAVWDALKKVTSQLDEYEKKLRLYQKDQFINEKLNKLKNHVDEIGLEIINQLEERE